MAQRLESVVRANGESSLARASHSHDSVASASAVVRLLVALLGMSVTLDRFVPVTLGPITPTFVIGISLGVVGWWTGVTDGVLRTYVRWIAGFAIAAVVSLVAAGHPGDLRTQGGILAWFIVLPGLAVLLKDPARFRAMLVGLAAGAGVLIVVVVMRLLGGRSAMDAGAAQLLGLNRNAIDLSIVWLVPAVLVSTTLRMPRVLRYAFIGGSIAWLVNSEGRTGLLALLLTPFLLVVLKRRNPNTSRAPRVLAVVAAAALAYTGLVNLQVSWLPAASRIAQLDSGERTDSDEARILLNKKSIELVKKNPVFGVGMGRYSATYDPIIETAPRPRVMRLAQRLPSHNTYLEVLSTMGVPGFIFFVGALVTPLLYGIRFSQNDDVRAVTAGYVIVLFSIGLHTALGIILFLPMALTLAAAARAAEGSFVPSD